MIDRSSELKRALADAKLAMSLRDSIRDLGDVEIAHAMARMSPAEQAAVARAMLKWQFIARKKQLAPEGDWTIWLIKAGRAFGKTRTATEWLYDRADSGQMRHGIIVTRTHADLNRTAINGPSGLKTLSRSRPHNPCEYVGGDQKEVRWQNGARALCFTAQDPEAMRGPEADTLWADELASWRYVQACWDNITLMFRLVDGHGKNGQGIITTTPKKIKLLQEIMADTTDTVVTEGSTLENERNLAPKFIAALKRRYEGTRLWRQEVLAEILDDVEGALWTQALIRAAQESYDPAMGLGRIVVGVDPAVTSKKESDETGIVVAARREDGGFTVLEDLSGKHHVKDWGRIAVEAYRRHNASAIVAEVNNGGDLVESNIMGADPAESVVVKMVHASKSKETRAEPIAALYEQGRVSHRRNLTKLEDQLTSWAVGTDSPDRLDAMVWALEDLRNSPIVRAPPPKPAAGFY